MPAAMLAPAKKRVKVGIYVGVRQHFDSSGMYLYTVWEVFRSEEPPTEESIKGLFNYTFGGFKTIRAAKARIWLLDFCNPKWCDAKECEQIGKEHEAELRKMGRERLRR